MSSIVSGESALWHWLSPRPGWYSERARHIGLEHETRCTIFIEEVLYAKNVGGGSGIGVDDRLHKLVVDVKDGDYS